MAEVTCVVETCFHYVAMFTYSIVHKCFFTMFQLRSYGLSFHELHLWFEIFPVVETVRMDVARGLVSASVASRVMTANCSHIKGRGAARRRQGIRSFERCR
ncbi:hypothetical protein AVEN_223838-1 [Araneus ventricosus]|uniref:Uncharacterized protein n=1 Tax=Araneus ventricosus TaxID=182803 RepID=A0A4Y2FCF2_ARAVE|nr:hypothetical protein AVEN_223838-1 [Araneus ventricosus]